MYGRIMITMGTLAILILAFLIQPGCSGTPSNNETANRDLNHSKVDQASTTQSIIQEEAIIYACPMHPDEQSTNPDDRCPICGMKLVPLDEIAKDMPLYACPMHPDQHSTNPDDKCPICGMDLVLVEEMHDEEYGHEGHDHGH